MRPTIEKYLPEIEQIKTIKERLKECKEDWLETKPGKKGSKYMGVNTVRQILDNAVSGSTYWDSGLIEQWREEIYKLGDDKKTWSFDGYVYHVRGYLFIPGLGHREQYGCKIAIGGKDNQDSAYKAAASNMLVKAASLFGVGESLYSKIILEIEEEAAYEQLQSDPNYTFNQPQQPQGYYQQPQQQQYYQPSPNQQAQYYGAQQQPQQPQTHYQPQLDTAPQGWGQPQQQANWAADVNQEANGNFDPNNADTYPFNTFTPGTPEHAQWNQKHLPQTAQEQPQPPQAQPQSFTAQPQTKAEPQGFQAQGVTFGPPAGAEQPAVVTPQQSAIPVQWDQTEIQKIHGHKARLNISTDEALYPYLREFVKKDAVSNADLTPENLKDFNIFLEKFSA